MTIRDCPKCGGTHFGSLSCPMEDPPGTHAPKPQTAPTPPLDVEGLVPLCLTLRLQAEGEERASRSLTDARYGSSYQSTKKEQTARWKAADLLAAQAKRIEGLERQIEIRKQAAARHQVCSGHSGKQPTDGECIMCFAERHEAVRNRLDAKHELDRWKEEAESTVTELRAEGEALSHDLEMAQTELDKALIKSTTAEANHAAAAKMLNEQVAISERLEAEVERLTKTKG